jgi:hypothetical protein
VVSSSIPTKVDFKHKQGDTFSRVFTFTLDGEAADMTDVEPVLVINSDTVDNITLLNGFEWGTGADAHKLYLSKLWTEASGKYTYELQLTYPSGDISTKLKGTITIEAEIAE